MRKFEELKIAVAGTGYVGLSLAVLLAQHHTVTAVDIIAEKAELINSRKSPIRDEYIEKYLAEKNLDLTATLDGESAYSEADFVVIAAPTNYDSKKNYFDTSAVEAVIDLVMKVNPDAVMVIKSTVPVGYTEHIRKEKKRITLFSVRNFCGNPEPCMITFIPAGLLYPVILPLRKRRTSSRAFCRRERSKKKFPHCLWDLPRRRR